MCAAEVGEDEGPWLEIAEGEEAMLEVGRVGRVGDGCDADERAGEDG